MKRGVLRPLGERDFRLLWVGQSFSLVGDGFTTVALAWQAYQLSSEPGALAAVFVARSIPQVALLLVGGALVDRLPRREVVLATDLLRGAAVGFVAILAATGRLEIWHLVAMGGVVGVANAFFFPASTAIVPEVLPPRLLLSGNALWSFTRLTSENLVGPALGGVVVAAGGAAVAFAVDAGSFAIAAVAAAAMTRRAAPIRQSEAHLLGEIREGLGYVRATRWIWVGLLAAGAANFLINGPHSVLLPLLVKTTFDAGPTGLGFLYAASGVGGGLAALALGRRPLPHRPITTMFGFWALGGVSIGAVGLMPALAPAVPLQALVGIGLTVGNLLWFTLLQRLVPGRILGRVSALDTLVSLGLQPLSFAAVAPVGVLLGPGPTIAGGGFLAATITLAALFRPGVRNPDRSPSD